MTSKLFKVLFLLLLLIVSNSCKKDKPEDDIKPAERTLTLITDNVEPGEIVLAQASHQVSLNADTKISVNGQTVTVFDAGDNRLGFLMPVLPAGKVNVDYTNAGFAKKLDVNIKQYVPITEPETVINNFTSELDKVIVNLEEHTKNNITALNPEYIDLTKYLNQTIKDNIKGLSAEEKEQLAYLFRSNMPSATDFVLDSLHEDFYLKKDGSENDPGEALVKRGLSLGQKSGMALVSLTAGTALAYLPSPLFYDKIASVGLLTVGLVSLQSAISDAEIIGKLKGVAEKILEPFQKRENKIIFAAGLEEEIYFKAAYRNLSLADKTSSNTVIASIFSSLNKIQDGYNKSVDLANKVISWFPWESPKIPSYTNPIGISPSTKELNLPGNRLSLLNVSNNEIKVTYTQQGDHLKVRATSETITKETDFTFTVKFTDPHLGITLERQIAATLKPKTYFLLDDANAWVVPPTKFETDKARSFYLTEDKITKAAGIDYSKITFVNKSMDQKVLVSLTKDATSFSLKFTHSEETTQYNTIEIYYDGRLVQTIAAEITNPCSADKILGKWKLQDYYVDNNNPDGYSPNNNYYWNITIYENGKMEMQASSESTINDRTYSFSGCYFSYDYFGCRHGFLLKENITEYTVGGCGGFHHHVYTKQ